MLAISTAWNYSTEKKMEILLKEIKDLGVDAIELGYKLTVQQLNELIPLLSQMNMSVLSVHNFCPVPNDWPSPRHPSNYYRLSAVDEDERKKAVVWTKRAVDTAQQVGAKIVVIHAGTVEVMHDPVETLRRFKSGQTGAAEFNHIRQQIIEERGRYKKDFLDAVTKSLEEVISYSRKSKILIGLETRYYPTEIPNFEEIGSFLKMFNEDEMAFWHDTGHGEVNVRLGFVKAHEDYFREYGHRLVGMHIHGVDVIKDHQAPFCGNFDLTPLFPFMKGKIKVIESHAYATAEQMREAVQQLKRI